MTVGTPELRARLRELDIDYSEGFLLDGEGRINRGNVTNLGNGVMVEEEPDGTFTLFDVDGETLLAMLAAMGGAS